MFNQMKLKNCYEFGWSISTNQLLIENNRQLWVAQPSTKQLWSKAKPSTFWTTCTSPERTSNSAITRKWVAHLEIWQIARKWFFMTSSKLFWILRYYPILNLMWLKEFVVSSLWLNNSIGKANLLIEHARND